MSADDAQAEPTMEEILASIRRIISEDDAEDGDGEVLDLEESGADENASEESEDLAPQTPPPVDLDDIAEFDENAPLCAPEEDDEIIEDGWGIDPADLEDDPPEEDSFDATDFGLEEDIVEETTPEPEPTPAPQPVAQMVEETPPVGDGLVADATAQATAGALGKLMGSMMTSQGMTLEDLVREMLRPMLKEWLDDNLPQLVEQEVQKELRRISRIAGQ